MKFPAMSANVTNVNTRKEKHGEDNVLAVDVKMTVKGTPQQIIDPFSLAHRKAMFQTEEGKEHLQRVVEVGSFTWDREYEDAKLNLAGEGYEEVTLKGFSFTMTEGGVVALTFTASFLPQTDDVGPLAELIKEACTVSFVTQADLVDQQQQAA
jgi:hypothetical protein